MGSRVVVDSNVLIDLLAGRQSALDELRKHSSLAISIVTWIEVIGGLRQSEVHLRKAVQDTFEIILLSAAIAEEAVLLRQTTHLKLPDAVVLATAHVEQSLLLTRNTRDFQEGRFIRIPYRL